MAFIYSDSNKRYHTLDYFYRHKFDSKVFKVSLNGNFTCPNLDGTKGYGGCVFCLNGSSEYGGNKKHDLVTQFEEIKNILIKKWPNSKYIAYFQANSNTYDSLENLKKKYESVLTLDNVVGLNIATRPDAIAPDVMDYLEELSKKTYLTIELGLQTIHEKTSNLINRCHSLQEFEDTLLELRKRNINVVVHIINGLPYETKEMMLDTVRYLNKFDIQGIKIHMLSIVSNTKLAQMYKEKPFHILTREEYVDIVCDQLRLLKEEIVINRITGDPNKDILIEPNWLVKKLCVLNEIDKEMVKRNIFQGDKKGTN